MSKKMARLRRAKRSRMKIRQLGAIRLCVHRTPRHIYAQLIQLGTLGQSDKVLATASTLDKEMNALGVIKGNVTAAMQVGKLIAARALALGVEKVAFDRSGYKYHGRIKALADAAREGGLNF